MIMTQYPIDIVVPWVDGFDPIWRKERDKYHPMPGSDNCEARYRDWGLFRYWFRSIAQFAPWVHKIHLVTYGHVPKWLNLSHPKLHIVNHKDYIPEEYLPTFSSHVIELNMHRIPNLSEHFVYFNDDVYLNRPTTAGDFFINGLPVDSAILGMVSISDQVSFMPYIMLNMLGIINQNFSKRQIVMKNLSKWFSAQYGKLIFHNLYFFPGRNFGGFRNFHTCIPYRRQTLNLIWNTFPEPLKNTCSHRFRSRTDINQYFFRYWQLLRGEFMPGRPNSTYLTIGEDDAAAISAALSGRKKIICINDDPADFDFETEQKKLLAIFETKFPKACEFEKKDAVQ